MRAVEEVQADGRPRPLRVSITRRLHVGASILEIKPPTPPGYVQVAERVDARHGGVVHFHYMREDALEHAGPT